MWYSADICFVARRNTIKNKVKPNNSNNWYDFLLIFHMEPIKLRCLFSFIPYESSAELNILPRPREQSVLWNNLGNIQKNVASWPGLETTLIFDLAFIESVKSCLREKKTPEIYLFWLG